MKDMGILVSDKSVASWEITAYSIIENEISKIEAEERKKARGSKRNH